MTKDSLPQRPVRSNLDYPQEFTYLDRLFDTKIETSGTGYPAMDPEKYRYAQQIELTTGDDFRALFTYDLGVWAQLEDKYGIEVEREMYAGACEDYASDQRSDVPKRVLSDKAWIENTVVDPSELQSGVEYVVLYWSDEMHTYKDAVRLGFIGESQNVREGRLIPSHVALMKDNRLKSKFSMSGPIVHHDIGQVPHHYGNVVTYHKIN